MGKTLIAYFSTGGSGIGRTADKLMPYVRDAAFVDAQLVSSAADLR